MKITDTTPKEPQVTWKVGDYYRQTSGKLCRIGYDKNKGYFVIGLDDKWETADFTYKYYWKYLKGLINDHGKEYGMTKVRIKEIIVEEI